MIFSVSLLVAILPILSSAAPPSQIYLSSSTPSTAAPISIDALSPQQVNAVLASRLGVAGFERLPIVAGGRENGWEQLLVGSNPWEDQEQQTKAVVVLECPKEGCQGLLPPSLLASHKSYIVPSLPARSWTSLVLLHLHRLSSSLGIDLESNQGVQALIDSVKSIEGWTKWVGEELGARIGWENKFKAAVEPNRQHSILTDLDFVDDKIAQALVTDLESMASAVDSANKGSSIVALHLTSMAMIPKSYTKAIALFQSTLAATLASLSSTSNNELIVLTLQPYSPPLLRKRAAWLKPFDLSQVRRSAPVSSSSTLRKRAPEDDEEGRVPPVDAKTKSPVVPSGSTCFTSAEDVNNQTAECLGRGTAVLGVSSRKGECWVCSCRATFDEGGKKTTWKGEGCEKIDLSSDFNLIFFSSFGLFIVVLVSVMLLYSAGTGELPGTLAAVGGGLNGAAKRD